MNDLRPRLFLSLQRALLGSIYPSIRAIAAGYEGNKLKLVYYLDREPLEEDYENLSLVSTEVLADMEFTETEEECVFSNAPLSGLDHLSGWVYMRKEGSLDVGP